MLGNIADVIKNSDKLYQLAIKTPLMKAEKLSFCLKNNIYFKREDLQPVFSFKCRGAFQKMLALSDTEKQRGVLAASAGNHAQGVALSAKHFGLKATIVMPTTTPPIKVDAVRHYGAEVILYGDAYDDAYQHARKLEKKEKLTFIHPFNDVDVITGQGYVAREIIQQSETLPDIIFVPVGGGGLLAGVIAFIKTFYPSVKIVGVEPVDAACLDAALKAKKPVLLDRVGIFVDGVAVNIIGDLTYDLVKDQLDDIVLVTTDEICAAIKDIFDDTRSIAEPAGALSLAGLKKFVDQHSITNKKLVSIVSGANINFDRLRHISERAEIGEQREALFSVAIPEKPGSFKAFCESLGHRSITEFNYRYTDGKQAHIFVGVEVREGKTEKDDILATVSHAGYEIEDLTDNEMVKLHLRHMIGGKATAIKDEKLFRFQFPERPGALLDFLTSLGNQWNISLFHYRNHGAAFGRVLVGIQVPDKDTTQLSQFLKELGYNYFSETDNVAYKTFL